MTPGELRAVILTALVGILVVCLNVGCSHLPAAKEACVGPEVRKQAVELVIPRISPVAMCVASFEGEQERQCIEAEANALATMATPAAYQCAMALLRDAAEAVR